LLVAVTFEAVHVAVRRMVFRLRMHPDYSYRTELTVRVYRRLLSLIYVHVTCLRMAMMLTSVVMALERKLLKNWCGKQIVDIKDGPRVEIFSEDPLADADVVFVFAHGGGYFAGDASLWGFWFASLVRLIPGKKCAVVSVEYRMAPEYPVDTGAGVKDMLEAGTWVKETCPRAKVIWAGDSAGGGLALASILEARDGSDPLPEGLLLICPWVSAKMPATYGEFDLIPNGFLEKCLDMYKGKVSARNRALRRTSQNIYLAPDVLKLQGLPPTMVVAGELDSLAGQATDLNENLRKCGVKSKLHVGASMPHDFLVCENLMFGLLGFDEATRLVAMEEVRKFVDSVAQLAGE